MSTDFSNKQAFLKELEQMLPDDAYYFQFTLHYSSREPLRVGPGYAPSGLIVREVSEEPISRDPIRRDARYGVKGQL